jgi:hypothetical protein
VGSDWPRGRHITAIPGVTFIVDHDGIVYQKNFWPETAALVRAITRATIRISSWQKAKP